MGLWEGGCCTSPCITAANVDASLHVIPVSTAGRATPPDGGRTGRAGGADGL